RIQRVENPRVEADEHPFLVVAKKLRENLGYQPKTPLEVEIDRMFTLLLQPRVRERLESVRDTVFPKTWWSGEHKEAMTLEVYEPGTRVTAGYSPDLVVSDHDGGE
ncbi:hypothetical protein KAT55_10225, partial [Candidatus Bathyarchaeota archaeon]|nr:hypothetical protein [Candidatus Bathyarchaeota archaeon]